MDALPLRYGYLFGLERSACGGHQPSQDVNLSLYCSHSFPIFFKNSSLLCHLKHKGKKKAKQGHYREAQHLGGGTNVRMWLGRASGTKKGFPSVAGRWRRRGVVEKKDERMVEACTTVKQRKRYLRNYAPVRRAELMQIQRNCGTQSVTVDQCTNAEGTKCSHAINNTQRLRPREAQRDKSRESIGRAYV